MSDPSQAFGQRLSRVIEAHRAGHSTSHASFDDSEDDDDDKSASLKDFMSLDSSDSDDDIRRPRHPDTGSGRFTRAVRFVSSGLSKAADEGAIAASSQQSSSANVTMSDEPLRDASARSESPPLRPVIGFPPRLPQPPPPPVTVHARQPFAATSSSQSSPTSMRSNARLGTANITAANTGIDASSVALKMLSKMGFTGRLGKSESGIAVPIIPTVRPKNAGLGMIDERAEARKAAKAKTHEEEKIEDEADKPRPMQSVAAAAQRAKYKAGAKSKLGTHRNRRTDDWTASAGSVRALDSIVDMTSGAPIQRTFADWYRNNRVVSDSDSDDDHRNTVIPLDQLRNADFVSSISEADVRNLEARRSRCQSRIEAIRVEMAAVEVNLTKYQNSVTRLAAIEARVAQAKQLLDSADEGHDTAMKAVDELMDNLSQQYRNEFQRYRISELGLALVVPLVQRWTATWQPLDASDTESDQRMFESLARWRKRMEGDKHRDSNLRDDMFASPTATASSTDATFYYQLIDSTIVPKLRLALSSHGLSFTDMSSVTGITALLSSIATIAPTALYRSLLHSVVIPRLQHAIDGWNPRLHDSVSDMARIVVAFAEVFDDDSIAQIDVLVQSKLSIIARQWRVEDLTTIATVKRWRCDYQWSSRQLHHFLHRNIDNKLIALMERTVIDRQSLPDSASIATLLPWLELMDASGAARLIAQHVMPKWLAALYHWLRSADTDLSAVSRWYSLWKAALVTLDRSREPVLLECFKCGLDLLNAAVEQQPKHLDTIHSQNRAWLAQQRVGGPSLASPAVMVRSKSAASTSDYAITLQSVLSSLAAQHALDFVPHPSLSAIGGSPVFSFGSVAVHWRGRTVYALGGDKRTWDVVSLAELVEHATKSTATVE